MQHYIDSVTAFNGDKITNAVISVTTLAGNGVTIYLDEAGLMPVSFVNSDENGEFNFYIPSGRYNINVSGTGITSYTLSDVFIEYLNNDPINASTGTFTGILTSTVATGTAPFVVASTTPVANLSIGGSASGLSSTLAVTSGGTGLTSLTAGYIPYGNGNSAFSSSSNLTFNGSILSLNSTDAILIPKGTTGQQPTGVAGYLRFNTTSNAFEGHNGTAWGSIGGGATGGGNDQVFVQNSMTVTTSYAIPSGKSASSVGAITINSGVAVTVPSGSRWVVL